MWELLPTDYEDIKYKGKKKYDIIKNDDGTVLIRDLTDYINLEKTFFGAEQANKMNEALNKIMDALEVKHINLYKEFNDYFNIQQKMFERKKFEILEKFNQEMLNLKINKIEEFYAWFYKTRKTFRNWTPGNLSDRLDDNEKLFLELNSMWLHNNFTACLIIEDDKDDFIILQDDERNAILADWRYKEL